MYVPYMDLPADDEFEGGHVEGQQEGDEYNDDDEDDHDEVAGDVWIVIHKHMYLISVFSFNALALFKIY